MAATDVVTKRIHVGGLTPSITPAHIKDRFKSFGTVLEVEDLKADALGQPRPFTFFTIQTTPAQLVKCLNIMSGSMWRGCQLRLAEAKPRYDIRLEKERNPTQASIDDRLRKRKRRAITVRASDVGKEAQDMRIPNEENYTTKKFWTVDSDGHLIRPITIRPTHPLPRPDIVIAKKADGEKKKRRNPPSKLNMRIINPTLWKPTHLNESSLQDDEDEEREEGWEFESASEEEEDDEGKVLAGRWLKSTEAGVEAEEVWVAGRAVPEYLPVEEEDVVESGAQGLRSVSPLFAGRKNRSASPLFPTQRTAEGSASPLFGTRRQVIEEETPAAMEVEAEESEDDFPFFTTTTAAAPSRSASPLFANRPTSTIKPVERAAPIITKQVERLPPVSAKQIQKPQTASAKQVERPQAASKKQAERQPSPIAKREVVIKQTEATLPDPVRDTARAEKSRDLGLLASFLGEEVSAAAKPTRGEWAGFDEDEDDVEEEEDEFEGVQPLRIRGGKGDEDEDMEESSSEDSDSDSDDSSSDSSDSDIDSESDGNEVEVKMTTPYTSSAVPTPTEPTPASSSISAPAKTQSILKAMFAPAPATSSFLLGALDADIELDEELDIPLAPPPIKQVYEPAAALQPLAASKKSHFDPDANIPLFFPTFGKGGKDGMKEDTEKEGYVGFWKQETDEEMKEIWEKDKVELTRDWKKRYRDGKKQRKRRGGGNDVE